MCNQETVIPSWEQVKELIPASVSLHYVDYRDSLDNSLKVVQKCIHAGCSESLDEMIWEWCVDDNYALYEYLKELQKDIEDEFDIEDAEYIIEEYDQMIRDILYDRDDSDMLKDLLSNTSDPVCFYDTGHYVESQYGESEAHYRLERIKIKKLLSINESTYDKLLDMMIAQASYGGQLHVYFEGDLDSMLSISEDVTHVHFSGNVHIGIIDSCNGSGDITEFKMDFKLPFNRKNIFIDECTHYNWTYDISGMYSGWCGSTNVDFLVEEVKQVIPDSPMTAHMEREERLNEIYKSGKCVAGDMDYSRHRNLEYINNFPCGSKCKDCGTFFID